MKTYKEIIDEGRRAIAEALGGIKGEKFLKECAEYDAIREHYGISEADKFITDLGEESEWERLKKSRPKKDKITVFCYDADGNLKHIFASLADCSRFFNGKPNGLFAGYVKKEKIYKGYLLSFREMTKQEAKELYAERLKKYKPKSDKVTVYCYDCDGDLKDIFASLAECSQFINGKKHGVMAEYVRQEKVYRGYLLCGRMMTAEQAREMYMNAERILPRGKYERKKAVT